MGLLQQAARLLRRAAAATGPPEEHGQRDQTLLHAVVQVPLDAPALSVDGLEHRRPAGGQLVDALLHQLALRGPEALASHPRIERLQREQPLYVQEEQHPAEQDLGDQFPAVEGAPNQTRDKQTREDGAEREEAKHHAGDQAGVGTGGQVAQDALVGHGTIGEGVPEEDRAAPPFEGRQPPGSEGEDDERPAPGARPQQERAEQDTGDDEVHQSQQRGQAAEEDARGAQGQRRGGLRRGLASRRRGSRHRREGLDDHARRIPLHAR